MQKYANTYGHLRLNNYAVRVQPKLKRLHNGTDYMMQSPRSIKYVPKSSQQKIIAKEAISTMPGNDSERLKLASSVFTEQKCISFAPQYELYNRGIMYYVDIPVIRCMYVCADSCVLHAVRT